MGIIAKITGKPGRKKEESPAFPNTPEGNMESALYHLRLHAAAYSDSNVQVEATEAEKVKLEKEVADYLDTIDPTDAEAVGLISIKEGQLRLIPKYIEREEEKQSERGGKLCAELEDAAKAILACAGAEMERAVKAVEAAIAPWFPSYYVAEDRFAMVEAGMFNPARSMAMQSALVREVLHAELLSPLGWQRPHDTRLSRSPVNVAGYDRELLGRAMTLLRIYQAWQDNGRSFLVRKLPTAASAAQPASAPASPENAEKSL